MVIKTMFLVLVRGRPMALLENHEFQTPSQLLDWYADVIDFKRSELSWASVPVINNPKCETEPCQAPDEST